MKLRQECLEWRTAEGRIVAVDLRTRQVIETNRTGAVLWNRLLDSATREELVDALASTSSIGTERALPDVEAFLALLRTNDLLEE